MPAFATAPPAPRSNPYAAATAARAHSDDDPSGAPSPSGASFTPPPGDPVARASALGHYADAPPADQPGAISRAWTAAKDGASLFGELVGLAGFHMFSGIFEGDLDIGKGLYYAQRIHPGGVLSMIGLDAASRGSNTVHLKLDVFEKTFALSAGTLTITGVNAPGFASGPIRIDGLRASGSRSNADVSLGAAAATAPRFTVGGSSIAAGDVGLTRPHFDGATAGGSLHAGLKFDEAHVHGLAYPGLPPTNIDLLDAGMDFVKLSTAVAPLAPAPGGAPVAEPGAPGLPSAGNLLPAGSHINLDISGIRASVAMVDSDVDGSAGFEHFHIHLVGADGKDLASVGIDGFHATAGHGAAAGHIDRLSVMGAPGLIQQLLANPQARALPHVHEALDLLARYKLQPAAGLNLTLTDIGASQVGGVGGQTQASGNIATQLVIPDVGSLSLDVRGCAADVDEAASAASFDSLSLSLADAAGKEIGYLGLSGASAKQSADGKTAAGLKHITVRGDVTGLIKAAEAHLGGESRAVKGLLSSVKKMALTGNVSADVKGELDDGKLAISGDLDFKFDARAAGSEVTLHLADVKGADNASAMSTSFKRLNARLVHNGKEAARLSVEGFAGKEAKKGSSAIIDASKIVVHGDTPRIAEMLETLGKRAGAMPPAVKTIVDLVQAQGLAGNGDITLSHVHALLDGKGVHMKADVDAHVDVPGIGPTTVTLRGVNQAVDPKKGEISTFDRLEVVSGAPDGAQAVSVRIDNGSVAVGLTGDNPDVCVDVGHLDVQGDHQKANLVLEALAHKFNVIPEAGRQVLARIAGAGLGGTGSVIADKVHVGAKDGVVTVRADLHVNLDLPGVGKVAVKVQGFDGSIETGGDGPGGLAFESFSAVLTDARGVQAACVGIDGAAGKMRQPDAGAHADHVYVQGSGEHVASLMAGLSAHAGTLPPGMQKALRAVQTHAAEIKADATVSLAGADFRAGANPTVGLRDLALRGALVLGDAAGGMYSCPDAAIDLHAAKMELGTDGKPHRVEAGSLKASGTFRIPGKSGHAVVSTGPVVIMIGADGSLQTISGAQITASGELDSHPVAGGAHPTAAAGAPAHADPHATENLAASAAGLLRSAEIHTSTPLVAGRYGSGFVHASVPAGAALHIDLSVRNNAITAARVAARPAIDLPLGISATGAHIENKGGGLGEIATDIGWFADFIMGLFDIPDRLLTGESKIPLDLTKLVHAVMGHLDLGGGGGASKPAARRAPAGLSEDQKWLAQAHAEWAADAREHLADADNAAERKQVAREDAEDEPRSADIGGLATQGVQYLATSGTADLDLANGRATHVAGVDLGAGSHVHLKGSASSGGQVRLVADANATVAGQHVRVSGLDTGSAPLPTGNHIAFNSFRIAAIEWDGAGK